MEDIERTNPDCEHATKGYVKRLIRKSHKTPIDLRQYTVNIKNWECNDGLSCALAAVTGMGWIVAMTAKTEPVAAWVLGVATVCMMVVTLSLPDRPTAIISCDYDYHLPAEFKKYNPKKDNCPEVKK
jgi:hypothetical protein